jgi:hypothetical protein
VSTDVHGGAKLGWLVSPGDCADPGLASVRAQNVGAQSTTRKGPFMSIKLTDTQLVMLCAAAQREDRCLVASPKLKGAAALKVATRLMAAGFVEEIEAEARPRFGGAITKRVKPTHSSSRVPGPMRSASMKASSPRMAISKPARARAAIKEPFHQTRRSGRRPNRGSTLLLARALHVAAQSWRGSSNSFSETTAQPSTS